MEINLDLNVGEKKDGREEGGGVGFGSVSG